MAMMHTFVEYFVVDVFAEKAFKGNPAAVVLLEETKEEKWMSEVAMEFNLPITTYLTRINNYEDESSNPNFSIRWFTATKEVLICGHATVAAAHVLFTCGLVKSDVIEFSSICGLLTARKVEKEGDHFSVEIDLPLAFNIDCDPSEIPSLSSTLNGAHVVNVTKATMTGDLIVEVSSEQEVVNLKPDFKEIQKGSIGRGILITAFAPSGSKFDFISRVFLPNTGVDEDPVCGSAHCILGDYWSKKLGRSDLVAYQASARGGQVVIHVDAERQRARIRGNVVTVMKGFVVV